MSCTVCMRGKFAKSREGDQHNDIHTRVPVVEQTRREPPLPGRPSYRTRSHSPRAPLGGAAPIRRISRAPRFVRLPITRTSRAPWVAQHDRIHQGGLERVANAHAASTRPCLLIPVGAFARSSKCPVRPVQAVEEKGRVTKRQGDSSAGHVPLHNGAIGGGRQCGAGMWCCASMCPLWIRNIQLPLYHDQAPADHVGIPPSCRADYRAARESLQDAACKAACTCARNRAARRQVACRSSTARCADGEEGREASSGTGFERFVRGESLRKMIVMHVVLRSVPWYRVRRSRQR